MLILLSLTEQTVDIRIKQFNPSDDANFFLFVHEYESEIKKKKKKKK